MILVDKVTKGQSFNLGGYAGTGKTTQIQAVHEQFGEDLAYVAPTHAAAHVLREKGVPAQTMHSLIYTYDEANDMFIRRTKLDNVGIVCDEASMLTFGQIRDMEHFGKPVYLVGDPFQLQPVNGEAAFKPHHTLTEVLRHGGRVLRLATQVREEGEWDVEDVDWDYVYSADMTIVGKNKTRHAMNARIRAHRGLRGKVVVGDELMFLSNHRKGFNGQCFKVDKCGPTTRRHKGKVVYEINGLNCYFHDDLYKDLEFDPRVKIYPVTYAYARTCHKAQGSQANKVAIFYEPVGVADNWVYTGFTRAVVSARLFG